MKHFRIILAGLLVLSMAFGLFACGGGDQTSSAVSESKAESKVVSTVSKEESSAESSESAPASTFTVTVVDQDGAPVSGAMLQICKDACIPARTNENGIAVFNAEITDGYKLSVMSCPEGYTYDGEAEVKLSEGATEYTLVLTKGN